MISYQRPRAVPAARPPHQHRLPWWQVLLWSLLALALLAGGGGWLAYSCPRYYVSVDAQNHLALLRRWPLLPMLHPEQVPVAGLLPITPAEAAPGLQNNQGSDLSRGITMPDVEAGKYLLLNIVPQAIVSQLLKEAKTAVDAGDLPTAQRLLLKACTYGGDAHTLKQLQMLIDQKAKRQK